MAIVQKGSVDTSIKGITDRYTALAEQASGDTLARQEAILGITDKLINMYAPGGAFMEAGLGQIETQKGLDVGQQYHDVISRGLSGVSNYLPGQMSERWEATTGMPARLKLEDLAMERLASAQMAKANFLNTFESEGPDMEMFAKLMQQIGQGQQAGAADNFQSANYFNRNLLAERGVQFGGGYNPQPMATQTPTKEQAPQDPKSFWGDQNTYKNLLGDFDPEAANAKAGNQTESQVTQAYSPGGGSTATPTTTTHTGYKREGMANKKYGPEGKPAGTVWTNPYKTAWGEPK